MDQIEPFVAVEKNIVHIDIIRKYRYKIYFDVTIYDFSVYLYKWISIYLEYQQTLKQKGLNHYFYSFLQALLDDAFNFMLCITILSKNALEYFISHVF